MHLLEAGVIKDKTSFEFATDYFKVAENQYAHYNNDICHKIGEFGRFFPAVKANPKDYILPQPDLRKMIEYLREKGVKTFLATNSHVEYAELIMSTTLGEDWMSLFDFISSKSCKPRFFLDRSVPFYEIDQTTPTLMGSPISDISGL